MQEHVRENLVDLARADAWAVRAGADEQPVFPDGTLWADPIGLPSWLRRRFQDRVHVMGFWCFENPDASKLSEVADRHDFALVDGRWIIDAWLPCIQGFPGDEIIDTAEEGWSDKYGQFYGDATRWERNHHLESEIDREDKAKRSKLLLALSEHDCAGHAASPMC